MTVDEKGSVTPAAALLRNRTFLLFQGRATANAVGYGVYLGTVLWISYLLTGGILWSGIIIGIQTAIFTLTFLIGPLVDRAHDKRAVFLVCYPLQATLAVGLALSYSTKSLSIALLVLIVVLFAIIYDFTESAEQTTTRILFGKDNLFVVTGVGGAIGGALSIGLYLATGASISVYGALGSASLLAGLLATAALLAAFLPIPTPNVPTQSWWALFREGWSEFRGTQGRPLRHLSVQQAILGFFLPAPTLLMTLYVGRYFSAAQSGFAAFYVAYLIGGIVLGLLLGYLNPRRSIGAVLLASMFVVGVTLIGVYLAVVSLVASTLVWCVIGGADQTRSNCTWLYLQGRVEANKIARVTMNMYLFTGASSAVGATVIGILSVVWTAPEVTFLVAAGYISAAILGLVLEETRRLSF